MKNTIKEITMTKKEYELDDVALYDIMERWFSAGKGTLNKFDQKKVKKMISKLGRAISEARASSIIENLYESKLIYSNVKFSATKGEAKGIDLVHKKDNNYFIIEVKYTSNYPANNLSNAKKQLLNRFKKISLDQLSSVIRLSNGDNENLVKIFDKYIDANTDFLHLKEPSIVPMATIITGKKHTPKATEWLHILEVYIEDEND